MGLIFCRFVTIHAFDRQTDGQLSRGYAVRCITCSRTVIMHEDSVILQSLSNTTIAPLSQFRLQGLLREHILTYLHTYRTKCLI